nr:small polypeptide DEVIL 15-like [Ziziphus jujuba var. spinosa]
MVKCDPSIGLLKNSFTPPLNQNLGPYPFPFLSSSSSCPFSDFLNPSGTQLDSLLLHPPGSSMKRWFYKNRAFYEIPFAKEFDQEEVMGWSWCITSSATSTSSSMEEAGKKKKELRSLREKWLGRAREYRSRFYILRKCVVMLLCWHRFG